MKAIYINLDPYLAAFAAWLKAGKPGTAPSFAPLPLAVTIPLGESACILCPGAGTRENEPTEQTATIDGVGVCFVDYGGGDDIAADALDVNVQPGLSALAPTAKYYVKAVSGASVARTIHIYDVATAEETCDITFTVLVRREQASGPVDLVDFTPPAAPITAAQINTALGGSGAAEGQPLKGVSLTNATNAPAPTAAAIKSTLVAAGNGALAGVSLGGAILEISSEQSIDETTHARWFDGSDDHFTAVVAEDNGSIKADASIPVE